MSELFNTSRHGGIYGSQRPSLTVVCSKCGSPNIETKNHAKRIGGVLGTCAGVMRSLSGTAIAFRATTPTMLLVRFTAPVLGALAASAMGYATGAALGQLIDETVLNNHQCLRCNHSFQTP